MTFTAFNINAQTLKVAILDFENISGIIKYDGLGKAMSSMLITDIEANVSPKRLQLVERAQIQKILKEQNFQKTSSVDKATTVKAGKILGVKYLLVGDIYILNDALIINARLIDAESGDIKFSKKQEGKVAAWLMLKTIIAKELAASISMPFTEPNIPDKEMNVATITTFGNAVAAKDDGKLEKAEELLNTVQEFSPDFKYLDDLKSQLDELKKSIQNVQKTADIINQKQDIVVDEIGKLNNISQELLQALNPKKIIFSTELKNKINNQLKDINYKKYYNEVLDPYSTVENLEEQKYNNNYVEKIKLTRKEVALKYPNTDIGYFSRSYFEQLNGNIELAVSLNDSATAINPLFWPSYFKNGVMKNDLDYLNKAIKANPNSIIAREVRGLYYQTSHPSTDVAFKINQGKIDFQECYKITKHPRYLLLECGLYWDFKYWSGICQIMNDENRRLMQETKLFQENISITSPMFALCENEDKIATLKDIYSDKYKYEKKKVILHLVYESKNMVNDLRRPEKYYYSITCKSTNEIIDFSPLKAVTIDLYINRHTLEKDFDKIRKLKNGELLTVVVDISNENEYRLIADVDFIDFGFKSYVQLNYNESKIREVQQNGIVDYNKYGLNIFNCVNDVLSSNDGLNSDLLKCYLSKDLNYLYDLYYNNSGMLNNIGWYVLNNKGQLDNYSIALKMIERASYIQFDEDYNILDSYAFALLKNGQKEKGKVTLQKAIALAQKNNDTSAVKSYQDKLSKY